MIRRRCQLGYLCYLLVWSGGAAAAETATLQPKPEAAPIPTVSQLPSPDWRDQVIYFVLTDRFADGDPSNNDQGAGEYNPAKSSHYSGGDLAGIQSKLDYIQNLGATAVWLTPPVAHQWWSQKAQYGGYHGYWATDFTKVDPHYGDLTSYRALANDLHQRKMYLIQDIVVNHTGNFFGYSGEYDANNTAKNFALYEAKTSQQAAPSQWPFSQINRLNPEHAAADIYHWTPPIVDPTIPGQEFNYQLASLADLNTSNPKVRQALKQSYRYWLEQVGVDAFRIDTAKYVEHDFWRDFLHAPDGIFAAATQLGKQHFLAFGEVFAASKPFQNDGEQQLQAFLGTAAEPQLNSVIAFPLYFDINAVLAEGRPPALLGYRLQQHSSLFDNPHLLPTFINNHDTKRFLAAGSVEAFIQAYALLFTIPGIPVIYQGDEQLLTQTRQAMFQGGWGNTRDSQEQFQTQSMMYQLIQSLAKLRKDYPVLSRGDWSLLQADDNAAGILAYQMSPQAPNANKQSSPAAPIVVLMNTADSPRLVAALPTGFNNRQWQLLWQHGAKPAPISTDGEGHMTLELPARAVLVLQPLPASANSAVTPAKTAAASMHLTQQPAATPLSQDFVLAGKINHARLPLRLVQNGDLQKFAPFTSDAQGRFSITVPVRDLGEQQHQLRLYAPTLDWVSSEISYQTRVTTPEWQAAVADPENDDRGPTGSYQQPQHEHSQQQLDIRSVTAKAGGSNLQLQIQMQQISQFWAPANGFDNVHFAIFIHLPNRPDLAKASVLPGLNQQMPQGKSWQLGHFMFGWGNSVFNAQGASDRQTGTKLGAAPQLHVDLTKKLITVSYQGQALGIQDWTNAEIYLSTWDKTGEGVLRDLTPKTSAWNFGGAAADAPKVLDDLWLKLHKVPADHR
ncbi:alpha-amylase [Rheinheimera riviphila]|uniref:Alpha-amylase n=1 Tax=Rheinheimera riviphila TaxID=1834037 RepID=A0A437QMI5_9GAMM|nr:alpha-amylase family glycosyl hydrolase [Rheinheimera riviphila]RVU35725.1 alpha-amylase [Rheinheimera riviphila]